MNVRPHTHYSQLSWTDRVKRNAADIGQNFGRGIAMAVANPFLGPNNLVRCCRGQETKWFRIPSYHQERLRMREEAKSLEMPVRKVPPQVSEVSRMPTVSRMTRTSRKMHELRTLQAFRQAQEEIEMQAMQILCPKDVQRDEGSDAACRERVRPISPSPHPYGIVSMKEVADVLEKMGHGVDEVGKVKLMHDPALDYFALHTDSEVLEPEFTSAVELTPAGLRLLAAYYERKYGANIVFPDIDFRKPIDTQWAALRDFINPLRNGPDGRWAFLIGDLHSVPVIYVKENGREAVLVADSLGDGPNFMADRIAQAFAAGPSDRIGMRVLSVATRRQRDSWSCHADAMKVAVTLTGKVLGSNGKLGELLLPDLLEEIDGGPSVPRFGVHAISLPPEVLKQSQIADFIVKQMDSNALLRGDRKRRKLKRFLWNYTVEFTRKGKKKPRLDYLRQKGLRYAEIIQIEYYNQQLKEVLGDEWTTQKQIQFAGLMKAEVRGPRREGFNV